VSQSAFSQAMESSAAADVAAFSDGVGTYTSPAGVATSGVDYVMDREPQDEIDGDRGISSGQRATVRVATAALAAPVVTGTFTDADSVAWVVETVQIEGGIATLGLVRTADVEVSAVGGHRKGAAR